jgi:hypothetical protein
VYCEGNSLPAITFSLFFSNPNDDYFDSVRGLSYTGAAAITGDTLFNFTIGNCFTGDLDAFHASIAAMTGATFMKFGRAPHTCSTRKGASLTDASP